ncbi:MAG: UDP-N-acetylmuramoyl-L-alanyl-D-glutamate--2,6-diaminopimelate ligase [bacterium]
MSIQYDSRKVLPGDTFVAMPGFKVDGADYIPQAIKNGAKIIVAERKVSVPDGVRLELVPSARKALAHMAAKLYDFPSRKLQLIGITGTNGKTTTAYLIRSILERAGHRVGLIGTIDNSLTTPESLELQAIFASMVAQGVTHVVMEVSSHALAQDRVAYCDFDIAIFTNLTHDHLDYHHSFHEYLAAKKKLFERLKPEGLAIINVDDPASHFFLEVVRGEAATYGVSQAKHEPRDTSHNEFDTRVGDVQIRARDMVLKINGQEIRTPLIGMFNVYNIVAAFQCALALHVPQQVIKKGIESLKLVPGRVERIECGQPFSVIVDFAHTPDALQKLLETYRPITKGKLILVFGCPGDRDKTKRPEMGKIADQLADQVIVTTDDPHNEKPENIIKDIVAGFSNDKCFESIIDRKEAIEKALSMAKKDDTVLIAGRGHEKVQDFNGKKVPINDKEVVESYFTR